MSKRFERHVPPENTQIALTLIQSENDELRRENARLRAELNTTRALVPSPNTLAHLHPSMKLLHDTTINILQRMGQFAIAWSDYRVLITKIDALILFASAADLTGDKLRGKPSVLAGTREQLIDAIRALRDSVETLPNDPGERAALRRVEESNSARIRAIDEFMRSASGDKVNRLRAAVQRLDFSQVRDLAVIILEKPRQGRNPTINRRVKAYAQEYKYETGREWVDAAAALLRDLATKTRDDIDEEIYSTLVGYSAPVEAGDWFRKAYHKKTRG